MKNVFMIGFVFLSFIQFSFSVLSAELKSTHSIQKSDSILQIRNSVSVSLEAKAEIVAKADGGAKKMKVKNPFFECSFDGGLAKESEFRIVKGMKLNGKIQSNPISNELSFPLSENASKDIKWLLFCHVLGKVLFSEKTMVDDSFRSLATHDNDFKKRCIAVRGLAETTSDGVYFQCIESQATIGDFTSLLNKLNFHTEIY